MKKNEPFSLSRLKSPFLFLRFLPFGLVGTTFSKKQHAVRDERRKNEPKRRERNQRVRDYRACRSCAGENCGDKVEFKESEQAPVERTDDYQNISNNISDFHNLPS